MRYIKDLQEGVTVALEEICAERVEKYRKMLLPNEIADIDAAGSIKRREEMTVTRGMIKEIFGEHAMIRHNPDGSQYIADYKGYISISHTKGFACVAYSDSPVGVDAQQWSNALISTKEKYLNEAEIEAFGENKLQLLRAWCAKEATYKILRIKNLSLKAIDTTHFPEIVVTPTTDTLEPLYDTPIKIDCAVVLDKIRLNGAEIFVKPELCIVLIVK